MDSTIAEAFDEFVDALTQNTWGTFPSPRFWILKEDVDKHLIMGNSESDIVKGYFECLSGNSDVFESDSAEYTWENQRVEGNSHEENCEAIFQYFTSIADEIDLENVHNRLSNNTH